MDLKKGLRKVKQIEEFIERIGDDEYLVSKSGNLIQKRFLEIALELVKDATKHMGGSMYITYEDAIMLEYDRRVELLGRLSPIETAILLDLSRHRIYQIEIDAMKKLKNPKAVRILRQYLK